MNAVITLALAGFTEARRNRVTLVVVAFALVMILSTSIVLSLTVFTFDRVATDFGLGVMSLLLVGLAIFLSSNQLSREIDRRTVFLVLSRPVSRAQFVIGRVLGTIITLWVMLAAMTAIFFAQMALLELYITGAQAAAIAALAFELVLMTSLGAALSSVSGPLVSSMCAIGVYLIGHGAADLYEIATSSKSEMVKTVGRGMYWIIPQLDRLDYRIAAAHGLPVDWQQVAIACAYALAYAGVLLVVAIVAFRRADFK